MRRGRQRFLAKSGVMDRPASQANIHHHSSEHIKQRREMLIGVPRPRECHQHRHCDQHTQGVSIANHAGRWFPLINHERPALLNRGDSPFAFVTANETSATCTIAWRDACSPKIYNKNSSPLPFAFANCLDHHLNDLLGISISGLTLACDSFDSTGDHGTVSASARF